MGVFQDCLDNAKTFKATDQLAAFLQSKINSQVDPEANAAAAATNSVHDIAQSTQTSGNCTLTVTLRDGQTFTTGNIAFNAAAATIETAIDSAATSASIVGWTNGDITVSGTAINNADNIVLTFDGDSVSGAAHPVTVLNDVDGAGGAWGAVTITTRGQTVRRALDVMIALGVVDDGTIPEQDAAATTTAFAVGPNYGKFPGWAARALARELAVEDDNNDTYHAFVESLPMDDKARKAQYLGGSSVV